MSFTASPDESGIRIPIDVNGHAVYLWLEKDSAAESSGEEREISAKRPELQGALDDLSAVATQVAEQLRSLEASTVRIEFGCEFALESGKLVAVIGKATAKSAFKVGLEWTRPAA
jgi:hypothetical protein